LNTTLMPHSITHGDGCFAYFNKIRGILAETPIIPVTLITRPIMISLSPIC